MNTKLKGVLQLLVVFLVTAAVCVVAYTGIGGAKRGSAKNIRLGLDLAGGVSVTYEATKENPTAQEMKDTVYKMQMRVQNESTEASVYQEGDNRVTVDVPDVDDPQAVLDKLGKAGALEFVLYSNVTVGEDGKTATYDKKDVIIDGSMLKNAEAATQQDQSTGQTENVVKLSFDGKGTKKFKKVTTEHVGEQFSIIYDGEIVSSPVIREAIDGGEAVISGSFDEFSEAEDMASTLRIGALPLELKNIRSNIVGAKLGGNALKTSLIAGAIGLALVIIFMIVMYWISGVASSLALIFYVAASILAINALDVTLTLPGIAGVILAIGMAVDANCIIFTRIREELATGKTVRSSIKIGFEKALSAIIDGNVTTLIAALVLYIKGSGTVMGFAQTLAIGIVLSMFTAIFVTRWILYALVAIGFDDVKFYGVQKKRKSINFVGNIKKYVIISGCLLLLCIGGLVMNQVRTGQILNYSLDFLGGSSTSITFTDYQGEGFDASGNATSDFKNKITELIKTTAGVKEAELSDVSGEKTLIVRTPAYTEEQQKNVINTVEQTYGVSNKDIEVETISASVSEEMRKDAIVAVLIAAVGMLIYIWIRFKNLAFGASSVIALLHDVMVVLMVYAVGSAAITVGSTFIACMLTIVGYSINATIVVFDRVRENRKKLGNADLAEVVNASITETLSRSFNTSITTLIMVLCLAILGVDSIRQFAIPMMAGIISGCYSSICLAGTVWYFMNRSAQKRAKAKKTAKKSK
ncbi:MAG: protein translocase subunit SecD [Clostridiales bacterium]|nr:protein translocase subunit SecD [Clostridiales bacterium]